MTTQREKDNVAEFDYGCGPSNGSAPDTYRCRVNGDDEDSEYEEANNESNGDLDVQASRHVSSFHTFKF